MDLTELLSPITQAYMARVEQHAPALDAWDRIAPELPGHDKGRANEAARALLVAPPVETLEGEREFLLRSGFEAGLVTDAMVPKLMKVLRILASNYQAVTEYLRTQPALAMIHALHAEARRPERSTFGKALRAYKFSPMPPLAPPSAINIVDATRPVLDTMAGFLPSYAETVRAALHLTRVVDWPIPRLCASDPTPTEDPVALLRDAQREWDTEARHPLLELLLEDEVQLSVAWASGAARVDAEGIRYDDPEDPESEWSTHHLFAMVAFLEMASRHIGIAQALDLDPR